MAKKQSPGRIGDLKEVPNTNRKPAAAAGYNHVRVQVKGGAEINLLFTDHEIRRARERAIKNPEDLLTPNAFQNLFD